MSGATTSVPLTTVVGTMSTSLLNPMSRSSSESTNGQTQQKVAQIQPRTPTISTSTLQLTSAAPQTQVMEDERCCQSCCNCVRQVCTLENCGKCVENSALACGLFVVCILSCFDPQMRQEYWP